jgi:hypothetical protein
MSFFKPTVQSAKQIERREKIRAKGRKHFIFYRGMLGWGVPVFALTTLWNWHDRYGWEVPHGGNLHSESARIALRLVLWLTGGYFFGVALWKRFGFEHDAETESKS